MDVNLADFAAQSQQDSVARQALLAQMIRAQQTSAGQDQIAAATARAHGMDPMVAAANMSNNPALLAAAQTAQKSTQSRYAPHQMGTSGYVLPDTGDFVESPIYKDEKQAQRTMITENQKDRLSQARSALEQTLETRRQLAQQAEDARANQNDQNRALRLTIAGMMAGNRNERFENQKAQQQQHNVQQFGKELQKNALPEMSSAVEAVNGMLDKYPNGDIPGVGYLQKTASALPFGLNKVMVGEEGVANRGAIQALENIKALLRSGKAVTVPESVRLDIENMAGDKYSADDFRSAWNNRVLPALEAVRGNVHRSFDPTVVESYMKDADSNFDPRKSFIRPRAGKPTSSAPRGGVDPAVWAHMTPQEQALFK